MGTDSNQISQAQRELIEKEWGLDKPFLLRYADFMFKARGVIWGPRM
jgi:ABC-type dipeptide/oligopeptide/nickel transport system permease component